MTVDYEVHPTIQRIVDACLQAGYPFNEDYNGADSEGVNFAQMKTKNGQRHSSALAFPRPALERRNVSLAGIGDAAELEKHVINAPTYMFDEKGADMIWAAQG